MPAEVTEQEDKSEGVPFEMIHSGGGEMQSGTDKKKRDRGEEKEQYWSRSGSGRGFTDDKRWQDQFGMK